VAAHAWNHAESAAVVTSILHFEVGAGAVAGLRARFEDRRSEKFSMGKDVGDVKRSLAVGRRSLVDGFRPFAIQCKTEQRDEILLLGNNVVQGDLSQLVLMRVANDAADAGKGCDLFRGTLGIAAGYDDLGLRILATQAANRGAGILISGASDRAGIEHDHLGLSGRGAN